MNLPDKSSFLSQTPPFDQLTADEQSQVLAALTPRHFAAGQTLLKRWDNPAYLYLVIEGAVEELDADGIVARYGTGDSFDCKSLIEGRSQHSFIARDASHCYLLPARLFLTLIHSNDGFHDFYFQDLNRKLDALVAVQQQREAAAFMMARIGEGQLHPPLFVSPATTLQAAATLMQAENTSALLVRHDDGRVGIFTSRDMREHSVLLRKPDTTPLGNLASYELITLDRDDFLFNALAVMTRHAIRHLVIVQGSDILGILEQADLLQHLSHRSYFIANRIERAESAEELKDAGNQIPRMIRSLHERGVKARYIARLVTDLNRKIFRRIYEQVTPSDWQGRACLLVMGSEGRGEQLLRTDQDNGLILREAPDCADLTGKTQAFTAALEELGYPSCPGKVMVSNPAWAKPLAAFKQDVFRWLHQPDANAFMNLAIFYDAVAVAGDAALLDQLKAYLFQAFQDQAVTLRYFARSILAFATPLGLFNRFVVERSAPHAGELDIKKGGLFAIVHGVRSLALEHRLTETNTIARIQALSGRGPFDEQFTADLIEAFDFMSMLRLRVQLDKWEQGLPCDNYLHPDALTKLERSLLRDSLKIVKEFKTYISYHYKLNLVS